MPGFRIENLPTLTRKIHESQNKWRAKNWKKTLKEHNEEIEELLEKVSVFSKWENKLQKFDVAKKLIPEMFIDAFGSIHFACFGLYKYANMCLRSELETTLRLIFFFKHSVEFQWWLEGNKSYRSIMSKARDVWGQGYWYFEQLDNVKKFEELCDDDRKLFTKGSNLRKIYDILSQFIHSGAGHFQTRPDRFSPDYNMDEFKKWYSWCKNIQIYINIMLALGFSDEFKSMSNVARQKILNKGIGDYYKEKVKQTLDL